MILFQPDLSRFDEMSQFAKAHGLGLELMDLAFPATLDNTAEIERILELCKNMPIKSVHGPFIDLNFSGGDPEIFKISVKRLEQCAAATSRLGAKRMVVHSCFVPVLPPNDPLYDIWARTSAQVLIGIAQRFDIDICIENLLDITPDIILKMVTAANHPGIGVCLDVGHANFSRTAVDVWIKTLAPYISHVHLSDNNGIYDDHFALGEGNIDWHSVDKLLKKYSVTADYTLEVKPFESVVKSLTLIENGGMDYVRS